MSNVGSHKGVRTMPIQAYIVEYTDKEDGQKKARIAFIIGDEVRFLSDDAVSGQVQSWLSDNILKAAGVK